MFLTTIGIAALTHPLHTCLVCLIVARLVVEPFRAPNAAKRRARPSARLRAAGTRSATPPQAGATPGAMAGSLRVV